MVGGGGPVAGRSLTHPGIEHLIPKAAVEFLWVGLWGATRTGTVSHSEPAGASQAGVGNEGWELPGASSDPLGTLLCPPLPSLPMLSHQLVAHLETHEIPG